MTLEAVLLFETEHAAGRCLPVLPSAAILVEVEAPAAGSIGNGDTARRRGRPESAGGRPVGSSRSRDAVPRAMIENPDGVRSRRPFGLLRGHAVLVRRQPGVVIVGAPGKRAELMAITINHTSRLSGLALRKATTPPAAANAGPERRGGS